jgi:hypothetical protein
LYASPNIIRVIKSRRMRSAGRTARMGDIRNAYKILDGKPEGKIPCRRSRCRWKDNTRTDLREIRSEGVDWFHMAQRRDHWLDLVKTVMKLWVP